MPNKSLQKIRKGWHRWFAWRPVRLLNGRWAFFRHVERKYYYPTGRFVIKKGINEDRSKCHHRLKVMYRPVGSKREKRVYQRTHGTMYIDPKEFAQSEAFQKVIESCKA